jgi:hypothetical protein
MIQILSTKNAPFLLDAGSAPEGFRNPINDLSKTGLDLLPPARFARFPKEFSSS